MSNAPMVRFWLKEMVIYLKSTLPPIFSFGTSIYEICKVWLNVKLLIRESEPHAWIRYLWFAPFLFEWQRNCVPWLVHLFIDNIGMRNFIAVMISICLVVFRYFGKMMCGTSQMEVTNSNSKNVAAIQWCWRKLWISLSTNVENFVGDGKEIATTKYGLKQYNFSICKMNQFDFFLLGLRYYHSLSLIFRMYCTLAMIINHYCIYLPNTSRPFNMHYTWNILFALLKWYCTRSGI